MALPDFVRNGTLTTEGQKVKERIEAQLAAAHALVEEKQDIGFMNGLAGHLKHYYVNVSSAHLMTPEEWMRDYPYAASVVWEQVETARKLTEEAATAAAGQSDVVTRLDKLEQLIADLALKLTPAEKPAKAKAKPAPVENEVEGDEPPAVTPGEGADEKAE